MKRTSWNSALIIVIGVLIYSNTFHVPFLFDDVPNIVSNPVIKDLHYFTAPSDAYQLDPVHSLQRRYIGFLTFALNYRFGGLQVVGYHSVNILIHLCSALVVYWFIVVAFRTPALSPAASARNTQWFALISGLLFVSHPVQTQAVTYIVQRFASLTALFYLLSLTMYIKGRLGISLGEDTAQGVIYGRTTARRRAVLWYLASLASAVLAMKTKETAFTLPASLALFEFMFFDGSARKRAFYLVPFFLTMLIIPLALIGTEGPLGSMLDDMNKATKDSTAVLSRGEYLVTQFSVMGTYLRLLIFPVNQNLDYDYPLYSSFFQPEVLRSVVMLMIILGMAVYFFRRSRHEEKELRLASFGVFFVFLALSVESSVIPIADVIFEHRLYLPFAGACMVAAAFSSVCWRLLLHRAAAFRSMAATVLVCILFSFSSAAFMRNAVWRDAFSLWNDVVKKSPHKARGYINRGVSLMKEGDFDKAIDDETEAIRLDPDNAAAYGNLGDAYYQKGKSREAIEYLSRAIQLDPYYVEAYYNLGVVWGNRGNHETALQYFTRSIVINPSFTKAYIKRGIALMNINKRAQAAADFRAACAMYDEEGCSYLQRVAL